MNPLREFSKWFIRVVVVVWIIGAIYGGCIIVAQLIIVATTEYTSVMIDLTGYLMYIATPLTGGIIGYMAKAAFENREKIIRSFKFKKENADGRLNTDNAGSDNTGISGDNGYTHPFDQGETDGSAESKVDDVGQRGGGGGGTAVP